MEVQRRAGAPECPTRILPPDQRLQGQTGSDICHLGATRWEEPQIDLSGPPRARRLIQRLGDAALSPRPALYIGKTIAGLMYDLRRAPSLKILPAPLGTLSSSSISRDARAQRVSLTHFQLNLKVRAHASFCCTLSTLLISALHRQNASQDL